MSVMRRSGTEIFRYPTAIAGILIIAALVSLAIYTVVTIPYETAISLWRGGDNVWIDSPRNALPTWMQNFVQKKLPPTMTFDTKEQPGLKERTDMDGYSEVNAILEFDFDYDDFPSEITLFFTSPEECERPFAILTWITPDGRSIELTDLSINPQQRYAVSIDPKLTRLLNDTPPEIGLFSDPEADTPTPLKGTYKLVVEGYLFDEAADFDVKMVLYGKVHGLAGTDNERRDMMIALLWGTPIALSFGFLAALGSTIITFIISAIGVWYGRWVDALIQRITEVNMILPMLPILIMIGTFYSRSIWTILGVVIILGIFGSSIKTYRAMFLQVKEAPYIEAAKAYGASNARLIFRYMIPRMIPVLIPAFVTLIPSYVFLEASLAVLGIGDPVLPTWGKLLQDAWVNGALFQGYYYWVLQPALLLMLTGLGFAMVGFALDRIYNPRLRGR